MVGSTIEKPWGNYIMYCCNKEATVKIITLNSGEKLSLQSHRYRDELWIPLDEGLIVEIDMTEYKGKPFEEYWIQRTMLHRLSNPNKKPKRILEISFGKFNESDIKRYEDKYGRGVSKLPRRLRNLFQRK